MTKLLYMPGACSLGIHVLLHELGVKHDAQKIDGASGEQYKPGFTSINPKSKVPTLVRDDGSVLTEFPAIASWLAMTHPDKKMLSSDPEKMARTLETMDYIVSTMHMQGFSRIFRPGNFAFSEADHDKVKARGKEIAEKGLAVMDKQLDGKDYLMGDFSIADCALFYFETWADKIQLPMPANVKAHYERMKQRPAVQATLKAEAA